jgi:hypothetical protein
MHGDPVVSKLMSTTDSAEWEHVNTHQMPFETDHPQGLVRLGDDRFFLASVRFTKTEDGGPASTIEGQGFVTEIRQDGSKVEAVGRLQLGSGLVYHPGGLATDGEHIYVPVSEYRADSLCHIYRIDAATFEVVGDPVVFPDHIGALAIDTARRRIFGMSWAARRIYVWDFDWRLLYMNMNPVVNVDYQAIDFVGGNTLACGGFSKFELGGEEVLVGGIDLIDATTWLPYHRIMVTTRTHTGRLLCHNAFTHKLVYPDLYMAFVPDDDDDSRVEIYKV